MEVILSWWRSACCGDGLLFISLRNMAESRRTGLDYADRHSDIETDALSLAEEVLSIF